MKLDATAGLIANLRTARDEGVRVVLRVKGGGGTYEGHLGEVEDEFVVLEKLAGRDYFDALILVEAIVVLEVQTRGT